MHSVRAAGDLVLVSLDARHREQTRTWLNDPECMRLLNRDHVIDATEHARWFTQLESNPTVRYFAIQTATGEHIGNVWLADINTRHRKAEVRIMVGAEEARGRGHGTTALELLAAEAFGPMKLHRLYAYVLAFNPRARRAFERAGFGLEGTLRHDRRATGEWVDAWLLSRISDVSGSP